MLAFKVLYDQIQKKFIEEHAMASKQLIWALTQRNYCCILKYQNRLKTILIFVKLQTS
jgi:hypothetical protein